MELHHRSCVLPSNAPALPEPDTSVPSRVLQERSANRRHDYPEGGSSWKRLPSPLENVYSGRLGSYYTGNLASHFNGDKSEVQVEAEMKRLLKLLKNCDKYQKYRDRQPSETASAKENKEQRWPDHLEEAFFRALVRWPPMGRRKHMLDGSPRGRNELVAFSIERDTGEPRTRKQVSSHIQVLKPMLADQPQILVYMSTKDMGDRRGRTRHASSHYSHHRHRQTTHANNLKYDRSHTESNLHQGHLRSSLALAKIQSGYDESPYTVANFDMFVGVGERRHHDFAHLMSNSRLDDLQFTDTTSWSKQYPEFKFHPMSDFMDHHVLICDAYIKVMTEPPAGADLTITFDLGSQIDLSVYNSIECRTRFFENGKLVCQPAGDRSYEQDVTQTRTQEKYVAEKGVMHVHFGSKFWAYRMRKLGEWLATAARHEEQHERARYEELVRRELQHLTAAQDIYGIKDGVQTRLLTVLWRFSQTRTSHEAGRMTWRVANFGSYSPKKWIKEEESEHIRNAKELISSSNHTSASNAISLLSMPTSSSIYPSLPLDFPHPFVSHQPSLLDLDALALESLAPSDFSNPNSATSLSADYSQPHSLPSLSHSQDTAVGMLQLDPFPDANDFDFNGGTITLHTSCLEPLEPAINISAYESYTPAPHQQHPSTSFAFPNMSSIADLPDASNPFNDLCGIASVSCYATKPSWQHNPGLISHLESAAEAFGVGELSGMGEEVGYGGDAGAAFVGWKSAGGGGGGFEDTGVGAEGVVVRRDSKVGECRV